MKPNGNIEKTKTTMSPPSIKMRDRKGDVFFCCVSLTQRNNRPYKQNIIIILRLASDSTVTQQTNYSNTPPAYNSKISAKRFWSFETAAACKKEVFSKCTHTYTYSCCGCSAREHIICVQYKTLSKVNAKFIVRIPAKHDNLRYVNNALRIVSWVEHPRYWHDTLSAGFWNCSCLQKRSLQQIYTHTYTYTCCGCDAELPSHRRLSFICPVCFVVNIVSIPSSLHINNGQWQITDDYWLVVVVIVIVRCYIDGQFHKFGLQVVAGFNFYYYINHENWRFQFLQISK